MLEKIDQNVREKVDGYNSLLSNLMRAYDQKHCNKQQLRDFFKSYESGFTISDTTISFTSRNDGHFQSKNTHNAIPVENSLDSVNLPNSRRFLLMADSSIDELILTLNQRSKDEMHSISINVNFPNFIKPLLPEDIFDHYVVFYNGKYIYEDFHSGLSYKNDDSLFLGSKTVSSSSIIIQKIAGENFYVFLQPIYLGNRKLVIAGLHSVDTFTKEKKDRAHNHYFFNSCMSANTVVYSLVKNTGAGPLR
ncbi:hypothetical protein QEG73_02090 [Chitinophagaceae bacterium 26-R-25]|nr:hypothetical protein [Chitinophagaceae bacterium 26-R-25]